MAVQNVLTTHESTRLIELKDDYRPTCYEFDANATPFLTLLTGKAVDGASTPLNSAPVQTKGNFYWFEKEDVARYSTTTQAHTAAATTLTVADATILSYGDVLMVDTNPGGGAVGELMWIGAHVTATTTATVARAVGGTTAAPIASGARIVRVGSCLLEHDVLRKGAIEGARTRLEGACQEHRREVEMSERKLAADSWYEQSEFDLETAEALRQIKKDIEEMLWFNQTATVDTTTHATPAAGTFGFYRGAQTTSHFMSAGVDGRISTNIFSGGGNLQYLDFCDMIGAMCKQNSGRIDELRFFAFCGNPVKGQISEWGYQAIRTESQVGARWGLDVVEVICPRAPGPVKTIPFIYTPALDNTRMENGCYILNFGGREGGDIQYRYLQRGQPNPRSYDIVALNEDGEDISPIGGSGQTVRLWKAIVGLEMRHEKSHAKITNFCNRPY